MSLLRNMLSRPLWRCFCAHGAPLRLLATAPGNGKLTSSRQKQPTGDKPPKKSPVPETTRTKVEIGRVYEFHCLDVLNPLGFKLEHCGGAGDGGVDLKGDWTLPCGKTLKVNVQCKAHRRSPNPNFVQELENSHKKTDGVDLSLLVSSVCPNLKMIQAARRGGVPIFLVHIPENGPIKQWLANFPAMELLPDLVTAVFDDVMVGGRVRSSKLSMLYRMGNDELVSFF